MDEFGYLIDSSHLDSDDGDEKIPNQGSETTTYTDESNAESPSASDTKEPPASAQEADGTSTEEDKSENAGDAADGTHKEAQEASAAQNIQGGSASAPWLGSSVTGWLGMAAVEEPGNLVEGEKTDERQETQAEASFTSSMTEWLGLGGQGKPDDAVKSGEEDRGTADSFASTMTGWLGFGGKEETDHSAEKEQDEERDNGEAQEPVEKFRSRRMSLDLEGSQLHEVEKEEIGTLEWLGKGLSNKLGFGLTNQESGHETTTVKEAEGASKEEEEHPTSWFDMGVGNILDFKKDKSDVDESTESGFKETEEDKILEQKTGLEDVNTSQSQPALTEVVRIETSNESEVEETPKDHNVPSEIETAPGSTDPLTANSNNSDILVGTSDSSKDSVSTEGAASKDSQKDGFPQKKLNSFFPKGSKEEEEDNVLDDNKKEMNMLDGERSAEMENKDHQLPNSIENVGDDNNREPGEEETKTASDTDQGFLTQSDINLEADFSSVDLISKPTVQSAGEEGKAEVEERAETQNQIDSTEESTDTSVEMGASSDDHEGEGNNAERDLLQKNIPTALTDESAEQSQVSDGAEDGSAESQPVLPSGTAEERNERVSDEDDTLTARSEETSVDHSDSLALIDNKTEAETHQGELGQEGEVHPVEGSSQEFGSSHSTKGSTENMSDDASEEDRGTFYTSESTTQIEDDAGQDSVSPLMKQSDGDAHVLKEAEKDGEDNLQLAQTETMRFEKSVLKESGLQATIGFETETEEVEEQEETEELQGEEEVKALDKQQEVEEEKQGGERLQEVRESKEEGKQEDIEVLKKEEKQEAVDEINATKKQEEEIKEEEMQGEEEEQKDEMVEIEEEEKQEEVVKLQGEEKQEVVKEPKGDEKREEVEEFKEKQQQIDEFKEEKQEEVEELREESQREELKEVEETKEEEKKVGEEKQVQSSDHFQAEMENSLHSSPHHQKDSDRPESESNERETQGEKSLESVLSQTSTQTEKRDTENPQVEEEKREGENKDQGEGVKKGMKEEEAPENVEGERRDKEEEEELKCPNEVCPQASLDGFVRDRDGNDSENRWGAIDEEEMGTGEQNPMTNRDQTLADRIGVSDDNKTQPDDTETSSSRISTEKKTEQIHSDHKIDTEEDTGREEIHVRHGDMRVNEDADVPMRKSDGNTVGTEFRAEAGTEITDLSSDPVESQGPISDQVVPRVSQHPTASSLLSDGHNKGRAETESGGAFGFFKSTFSIFSQTPATESAPSLDSSKGETSEAQGSLTPEQEPDSTTDSTGVYIQGLHTDPHITLSQQQHSPPPFTLTPSPSYSHPSSLSANTGSPLQAKTLSKDYKTLLGHMSVDETAVLMELFGRHKLQFLDYILGSSETMTEELDNDESILLDIERLLRYHREELVAPSKRLADAPQEDKEKTSMLIALQKLEMLLARVRKTFNTGKSDIGNTNHQGIPVYMASKIQ